MMLTLLMMPLAIRLSNKTGIVDKPDDRKLHDTDIPILGGLVIAISFIVSCFFFLSLNQQLFGFFAGLIVITLTGLIDDLKHINHILKFIGEIAASLIFLIFSGNMIITFGDLIAIGPLDTGNLALPISVFCMVGVMNALNFADGLDGLAGGISIIACLFLIYFAFICNSWPYLIILSALFGSLLGFLYYNRHPAKIFMGDTGSLVLGYILSAMCIMLVQESACISSILPISMAIVMGIPIVDALLVMTIRMIKGRSPFFPDNTHLHHRLLILECSHANTVRIIYLLMLSCGLLAVVLRPFSEWLQFMIGVFYASVVFGVVYILSNTKLKQA